MSSLRYGFSTPYRLAIRNSTTLFNIVLFNMGDLHLVLPALNLSTLNAGILIMMQWDFSVSPRPLVLGFRVLGFWAKGLGPGIDNNQVDIPTFCPNELSTSYLLAVSKPVTASRISTFCLIRSWSTMVRYWSPGGQPGICKSYFDLPFFFFTWRKMGKGHGLASKLAHVRGRGSIAWLLHDGGRP